MFLLPLWIGWAVGCAPYPAAPMATVEPTPTFTHRVARGETLWRIARTYGVELEELARANKISDASRVKVGQALRIPAHRQAAAAVSPAREEFIWPVHGKVISFFGMRKGGNFNKGIDIQAPYGHEIQAARGGEVTFVHDQMPGFGKTIILDHGDGFATVYAYIGQILVQRGQQVAQRQVIATVGKTGRTEIAAVHFEVRRHQKPQNPFYYLP